MLLSLLQSIGYHQEQLLGDTGTFTLRDDAVQRGSPWRERLHLN